MNQKGKGVGSLRVAIASDLQLHLEFETITLPNTEGAKVLILAGDIVTAYALHENPHPIIPPAEHVIWKPSKGQQLAMRFREFFNHVSAEYEYVLMVAGNHELYHGNYPDAYDWLREEMKNYPNIHFLDHDKVEIDGITFLGGTLWTDMNKGDPTTLQLIEGMMNDFHIIRNSQQNYRKFLPMDAVAHHKSTLAYIKQTVDADPNKHYVVVGHMAPSALSIHPNYKNEYYMNGGYHSDLSEFILDRPQITHWFHGHMHNPSDYMMGETRIVCNPRGYHGEQSAKDFKLKFLDI